MDKSLLSNCALLSIKIPPLAFNCSYANSVINKIAESTYNLRNPHTFADSADKFCGFHLNFAASTYSCDPEKLAIFARCGICNKINVLTKFTLQVFVRGIHLNFVS